MRDSGRSQVRRMRPVVGLAPGSAAAATAAGAHRNAQPWQGPIRAACSALGSGALSVSAGADG
jgi:hypothetical protein